MRPDSATQGDPLHFEFVEPGRILKERPMVPILLMVVALVLFVLAALPVAIPKWPAPGWLGLAFLAAAQLWPLVVHFPGK
jgi:uncharacterized membrane protein